MNYRHAYHAGNFADVMKHVLLTRILVHLARKATPFRVIDTHAGIGLYDLAADEAERTGEWRGGVGRLDVPFAPEVEDLLRPYRQVLAACREREGPNAYPGSPAILREMLRPNDRAIAIEKHPEDGDRLAGRFAAASTMKILKVDGWRALGGLIPPRERRGLVLIDPPYEEPDELARAVERVAHAHRKWPTGMFALWYPIKEPAEIAAFARELDANRASPTLRLELTLDRPGSGPGLIGSGLAVVNPPWRLAEEAGVLLPALAARLGTANAGFVVDHRPGPDRAAGHGP